MLASVPSQSKTAPFNRSHHNPRPSNVTIWIASGLRTGYHCNRGDCGHGPKESMANKFPKSSQDKTADLLLAIGAGFLINLILGAAIPEVVPFIAVLVAGVIVKTGPFRGGVAGFLAVSAVLALSGGIIGGVVSLQHWPRIHALLMGGRIGFPLHLHHSAQMRVEKNKED